MKQEKTSEGSEESGASIIQGGYEKFLHDGVARVLLKMSGCHEILVNRAHELTFNTLMPRPASAVQAESIFFEELTKIKRKQEEERPCYCYATDAVVALEGRHCAFERTARKLREKNLPHDEDIAVFRSKQNGNRVYQFCTTRSRLIVVEGIEFLDVELSRLIGIKAIVTTVDRHDNDSARMFSVQVKLDRENYIKSFELKVKRGDAYRHIYDCIHLALAKLKGESGRSEEARQSALRQSKIALLDSLRAGVQYFNYDAISGFIHGIYGLNYEKSRRIKTFEEIVKELEFINDRLFDAEAVVDVVAARLLEDYTSWRKRAVITPVEKHEHNSTD